MLPRLGGALLLQINASEAVESLGGRGIILKSQLKTSFRLLQIAALEEDRSEGEIVARKLEAVAHPGKRQRLPQAFRRGLRNPAEGSLEMLRRNRALINLDDCSGLVDQEGCRKV